MFAKTTSNSIVSPHPVIIIVPSNSNEKIYKKRVDKSIEIFNQNVTFWENTELNVKQVYTYILFTGLYGKHVNIKPESEYMKQYAIEQGVPPECTITEYRSTSTVSNFINSFNIITQYMDDFNYNYNIHVVSSASHIKRCQLIVETIIKRTNCIYHRTNEKISNTQKINEEKCIQYLLDNT